MLNERWIVFQYINPVLFANLLRCRGGWGFGPRHEDVWLWRELCLKRGSWGILLGRRLKRGFITRRSLNNGLRGGRYGCWRRGRFSGCLLNDNGTTSIHPILRTTISAKNESNNVLIMSLFFRSGSIYFLLLTDFGLWRRMVLMRNTDTYDLRVIIAATYMGVSVAVVARQEWRALRDVYCCDRTLARFDFI